MSQKLFFVFNPQAGKSQIKPKLFQIIMTFANAGFQTTIVPTKGYLDAMEQVEKLPDGYDLVVCSGGDGTLDEVVTGMMNREVNRRIPIGYIPAGTTNDFARSLKIPRTFEKAALTAANGKRFPCDIGAFNDNYFVYIAAFGIFTDVSYTTKQETKNAIGHMAYVLEGMKRLYAIQSYNVKVTSEEMSFEGDFMFGMVTNSKSVGGFKSIVGKNVIFDDGVFEVTFIKRPRNPMELQEILAAFMDEEIDTHYMYSFKSKKVIIESTEYIPWTLDGEFGGEHCYVVIENKQKAIEIMIEHDEKLSILGGGSQ